jgi:hypothetical protein
MRPGDQFDLAGGPHLLGNCAWVEAQFLVVGEDLGEVLLKTQAIVLRLSFWKMND